MKRFIFFLSLLLAGCAAVPNLSLNGTNWSLVSINGTSPLAGSETTLTFSQDRVGGKAGCNSYGASFSAGGSGSLTIGQVVRTLMACDNPTGIMQQEDAYIAALEKAASFTLSSDRLEIKNAAGTTTLVFSRAR